MKKQKTQPDPTTIINTKGDNAIKPKDASEHEKLNPLAQKIAQKRVEYDKK